MGIPPWSLSKALQEAIFVTRKLGVRYLWIDCLCIIQGLHADFERECAMMGQVYQNAYCTIAATSAESGEDGLFGERNWMEYTPCTLAIKLETDPAEDDPAEDSVQHVDPCAGLNSRKVNISPHLPRWREEAEAGPLQKRAWYLQERELSPRIIHFSHYQLVWECRMSQGSEAVEGLHCSDAPARIFDEFVLSGETISFSFARWYSLLEDFSRRNITHSSDRLPAIEGLAQEVRRRHGYMYVAGLWKEDLIHGLLWTALRGNDKNTNAKALIRVVPSAAPSWSWASVEGPVAFFHKTSTRLHKDGDFCVTDL
jgi:hypothetical protein